MPGAESTEILTIGHSNLSYAQFVDLVQEARVTAVADVRSMPYSRHFPHFNREVFSEKLRIDSISYVFLGHELGGRPKGDSLFCKGVADYERMATASPFIAGLDRIVEGSARFRIALMCSEHDPLDCHRCLLIGRALAGRRITVTHILSNGLQTSQRRIEERLLALAGRDADDLFSSYEERLAASYRDHSSKVAFTAASTLHSTTIAAE